MGDRGPHLHHAPPAVTSLPSLPTDADLTAIGRITTRFPGSAFVDMLALRASGGTSDAEGLVARSRARELDGTDGRDLAWFAAVLAAEPAGRATLEDVADLLGHALTTEPELGPRIGGLWLQVLLLTGRLAAGEPGPAESDVEPDEWWAVSTDLLNPFDVEDAAGVTPGPGDVQTWLASLSRPFTDAGLSPVRLLDVTGAPFDRLTTDALPPAEGPLVSVVMPVHDPGPSLVTSVRSVLAQSWADLEVLLCDDASTSGRDLLEQCLALDPRVRLLRAAHNGGAYSARNLGLAHATGRFVTFQDADDFSHPQRIEREVRAVAARPGAVGAVAHTLRSTGALRVTALGLRKIALNLSSLLVDRERVVGRLGGFDAVRRSGDREFLGRIGAAFGPDAVVTMPEPLAVCQLTPGSLSRGDMGYLRRHAARQSYRAAAGAWHRDIESGTTSAYLRPGTRAPVPTPEYIVTGTSSEDAGTVDVVLLTNPAGTADPDVGGHVAALCDAGVDVGLLEFAGPADTRAVPGLPSEETAARLRSGRARWVLPGERVRARVGLVHDPAAVLTMPSAALADADVDHLVLRADRLGDYDPRAVSARARTASPGRVHWLPADDAVAGMLLDAVPRDSILPPAPWLVASASPRPGAPLSRDVVVGVIPTRFADREARTRWDRVFVPRDASIQVWGFGRGPGRRARRPVTRAGPPEMSWQAFLERVDYLVAPPTDAPHLTQRIVDAWAHGTVVLAPEELGPHLGTRAAYVGAVTVDECLARHQADPAVYAAIQHEALDWVRRHATPDGLVATYSAVLDQLDAR